MELQSTDPAVELRVRAEPGQLGVIRAVAATMATQCDFDLDEIADVRLAADEASSYLIVRAQPQATLSCRFLVQPGSLKMAVSTATVDSDASARRSFGWHVLTTLTDSLDMSQNPDPEHPGGFVATIEFSKHSIAAEADEGSDLA